jgi:integrase
MQTAETIQTQKTDNTTFIPSAQILEVKNNVVRLRLTKSPKGKSYRQPVEVSVPATLSRAEENLYRFVWESLSPSTPKLLTVAFQNQTLLKMAKYLSRNRSGSRQTCAQYLYMTIRYAEYNRISPDQLINRCFIDGVANPKAVNEETARVDDYVGELKARNLAPKTVSDQVKAIKVFYMCNGLTVTLPYRLSNNRTNRDRAPKPEELQKLIDIADVRDKVIVSMLALGGFRVGTLAKLKYYHVKEDLENNVLPIHIHVEAENTKGQYSDYDTFIGAEAVGYLKTYLNVRRHGSPCGKIPPETINEDSPLIVAAHGRNPKSVDGKVLYRAVHNLYMKAGMLETLRGRRYNLCAHSIRKFFRTQLAALGVPEYVIESMMGHILSTYQDLSMKGTEFLRNIYAASGLSIRPKTQLGRIDTLKEIIRAWGMNPEQILTQEALTQPNRTLITGTTYVDSEVQTLSTALKDMMRKELLSMKEQE